MKETSSRWRPIAPSEFPWERDALAFLRKGLPDHDPFVVWSNLEFVAEDGSIHEVDALVLTPKGFFLIEIKSWPGVLEGDASTWKLHRDGQTRTFDSPLLGANRKARKLASLLRRQKAAKGARLPMVEPMVFLSHPELKSKLSGAARQGVHLRDGILAALKLDPTAPYQPPGQVRIYRPVAQAVERAVEEAGIRPSQRSRRVSDYILEDLLYAGPNYQDWQAKHASSSKMHRRRVRIYPVATAAGAEARAQLERAARREMEILEGLSHPALLKPQHLTQHELGPALVFEHNPKALRLDHYLVQQGPRLDFSARLALIRQIAEALQYAHDKRVFHRALSPQSILIWDPEADSPDLRILNWQAAAQETLTTRATQAGLSGTSHLDELVEDASRVYLAPESLSLADASPETLDVFSLGAVAFFILSGQPPAASVLELHDRLREGKGLQLAAAVDGADADVAALIELATDPVVARRVPSVSEFLQFLEEKVEKDLPKADPAVITENPHDARTGDHLEGGFLVKSRLGKGSTSSVFLVEHNGKDEVLKLALDSQAGERLRAEAEVLKGLSHPRIVQFLDTATVSGRFGLLLSVAGEGTLAQRLRREGRLQLELLQRFGEDLLEAVDYLERTGVPHRDIKPDNLGVTKAGRNDELHLVLFDFSLTRTRAENIFAGTRPYLDPFLRERKPRRWDLQAERFAAAVTLYEMATGVLPRWGDGLSDPAMIEDEVHIEAELLDAAVRSSLTDFFRQALRRNPRQRFDNALEMLAAWSRAFAGTDRPATTTADADEQPDELARACAEASLETPVSLLHLSTRAVNALERAQVVTVHDLLRTPASRLNRLRGVGSKTRKELVDALEILTQRFGPQPTVPEPAPAPGPDSESTVVGLDLLVRQILPGRSSATGERRILETLFGLGSDSGPLSAWPSQTEAAEALDLTRARVSQILVKARQRWRRDRSLTLLRDDIARLLEAHGGAMTHEELCAALLATRGSVQEEPLRTRNAAAVLRAATEAEEGDRWIFRRDSMGRRVLFGLRLDDQPEALLDYADALGRNADELASQDPLPSPQRALEVLQEVTRPAAAPPLSGERLLRLATAASRTAALSSRQEIYPRGLAPDRALRLASGTLLGARELTVEAVRERLRGRFPEAAALPGRPRLDDLLTQSGLGLTWNASAANGQGAYRFPETVATGFSSTTLQRGKTTFNPQAGTEPSAEEVDIRIFEERLQRADREGAFLALVVPERSLTDAEEILARRFPGLQIHSLEALWLRAMRQLAAESRVDWNLVLRSDAEAAGHPDARNLRSFVRRALDRVEAELAASPRTILLTRAGLLARYGEMDFLDRLRERVTRRPAPGETGLHGLWLLVPSDAETAGPQIDGQPVAVPTPAHWTRIPRAWLRAHALKETA